MQLYGANSTIGTDPFDDKTGGKFAEAVRAVLKAVGFTLPASKTLTGSADSKTYDSAEVTINQSGTAGFVAWLLDVTETAVGSGAKLLQDLRVGGVSKFKVTDTGAVTSAAGITATTGDITATAGEFKASTAGKGLSIKEGANARMGVSSAMTSGSITISTTAIATGDRVFLQHVTPGGTLGLLSYGTIVNGTSFVINSSSNTDTSTVLWMIVKPL